jgi:hypothetical protein
MSIDIHKKLVFPIVLKMSSVITSDIDTSPSSINGINRVIVQDRVVRILKK